MSRSIAGVLLAHTPIQATEALNSYTRLICSCGARKEGLGSWLKIFALHQVEVLTEEGFGNVNEAAALALESAATELASLPYVKPGEEGRADYERLLAVRRGYADRWLRQRAAAIRG